MYEILLDTAICTKVRDSSVSDRCLSRLGQLHLEANDIMTLQSLAAEVRK